MANWDNPLLTSAYADFLSELKARDSDLAKMFDVGTPTNVLTDTIRWNSSAGRWEKWSGATWEELASIYNVNVDKLDGNDASDFAAAAHVGSGGAAHADVTTGVDGFMKAVDKTKLDNAVSAPTASRLIIRDVSGRARVAEPSNGSDIATKSYADGAAFPSGTVMLFHQDAAPTGWTKDEAATLDNAALRIVTSTAWGSGKQGATAFTSVFGSGKTTGAHTLTTGESAAHGHKLRKFTSAGATKANFSSAANDSVPANWDGPDSADTGGGGSHNHTLSLDLNYINMILASKD